MILTKDITSMVRDDAQSEFVMFHDGRLVYRIYHLESNSWYNYDIPIEETRGGIFNAKDKALYHIRWIRKAINSNQFRKEY